MGRLFGFASLLVLALIAGYVTVALRKEDSSDVVVKLLGPGKTASQCVKRFQPHFEKMEPAMTRIADAVLASEHIVDIGPGFDWPEDETSFIVNTSGRAAKYTLSEEELEFFRLEFKNLGARNYFTPERFGDDSDLVSVIALADCGVPLYEWIRFQLGLGWSERKYDAVATINSYIYDPNGTADLNECPAVPDKPAPAFFCVMKLNENWSWGLGWVGPPNEPE